MAGRSLEVFGRVVDRVEQRRLLGELSLQQRDARLDLEARGTDA